MGKGEEYIFLAVAIVIVFVVMVNYGVNPVIAGILSVAAFTGGIILTGSLQDLL